MTSSKIVISAVYTPIHKPVCEYIKVQIWKHINISISKYHIFAIDTERLIKLSWVHVHCKLPAILDIWRLYYQYIDCITKHTQTIHNWKVIDISVRELINVVSLMPFSNFKTSVCCIVLYTFTLSNSHKNLCLSILYVYILNHLYKCY